MTKALLVLILAAVSCFADMATFAKPSGGTEIKPQAVPTSLTTVITGDVHLSNLVIVVVSGTPTILVQDMQGTPIPLMPTIVTANNTVYFLPPGINYWCPGGFKIQASGSGAYFYASW